jgi:uncharacterized protein (TIGR02284 family)
VSEACEYNSQPGNQRGDCAHRPDLYSSLTPQKHPHRAAWFYSFKGMATFKRTTERLHSLVLVNNDRVKWYEKAINDVKDLEPSLAKVFEDFAEESRSFARELDEKIKLLGSEDGIESTTLSGEVFRVWSDLKSTFSGNPVESVLASSEHVEDRVQEAYSKALQHNEDMDNDSIQMLEQQQFVLKDMHDAMKEYRDETRMD